MSDQKRQHPLMILISVIQGLKNTLIPLFIVVIGDVFGGDISRAALVFFGGMGALAIALAIYYSISWAFYTYRFEAGYLYIKAGIIFKKERSIKRERVQTVNISSGILQRLLGVTSLQVETAGGGAQSELKLTAVTPEEARRIKKSLEGSKKAEEIIETEKTEDKTGKTDEKDQEGITAVYRVPLLDLFLAGATSGGFLLLFSLIAAAASQFYPYIPDDYWEYLLKQVTSSPVFIIIIMALFLLLLSWLISTVLFMIKHAYFTLRRSHDRLEVSWGLFERKQLTLKMHRLQAITIQEGLLRQPFSLCTITAEVAGGGSQDEDYITLLYPMMRRKKLKDFLGTVLPEYQLPDSLQKLPPRALKRYVFRAVLVALLVAIPLQWLPYGWLGFILLVPAAFLGILRYHAGGTLLEDNQITLGFRNLTRYRVLIKRNHVQSLEVNSNPFQRLNALRSVRGAVLSSPAGKLFQVTDVDREEASRIWKWYSRY